MFRAPESDLLVPFDGSFRIDRAPTAPPADAPRKSALRQELAAHVERARVQQQVLAADNRVALLVVFQAMDAAGKDGTIRAVLTGLDPAGCQVYSFARPSSEELDHDFLWRHVRALPERGRIGVFNRSWYEEVLVVRVREEALAAQRLPWRPAGERLWQERLESIADLERHLARNGTAIVKVFLHVSREAQRERLLARIDDPTRNWKFDAGDLVERARWDEYMAAYEEALNATSRPWAPWYAVPADDKPYLRARVAAILADALESLGLRYPEVDDKARERLRGLRGQLAPVKERA